MKMKKNDMKNPLLHWLKTNQEFKKFHSKAIENGLYIHSVTSTPNEWSHFDANEKEARSWYLPVCSLEEIERIFSPNNVSDLLLKYRADSIISNMRILRSFEKRACFVKESEWTLTNQFSDTYFSNFLDNVGAEYYEKIKNIPFGTIYSDDPNAYCVKTNYGPLILLSEALNKFFYYLSLSVYPYWSKEESIFSQQTQTQSLILGIRTMLLTEAFDFEIDPRGSPPDFVNSKIEEIVEAEMAFVIAHEYSHFLLGHLDERRFTNKMFSNIFPSDSGFKLKAMSIYNESQKQEFKADELAIEILSSSGPNKKGDWALFGITVMSCIDLFCNLVYRIRKLPPPKSHPPAYDRLKKMYYIGRKVWNQEELTTYKMLKKIFAFFKENLFYLYNTNPSVITGYGSIYLTQWRGDPKIDRIDY